MGISPGWFLWRIWAAHTVGGGQWRRVASLGLLSGWVMFVGLAACRNGAAPSAPPHPQPPPFSAPPASIQNIKQGAFRYTLPVDGIPMASGRGCALTKPEAETQAQHAAAYNLRSLLGQGKYQVGYRGLVLVADPYGRVCYEVEAYQTKR